jgi:hypothetical protein
MKTLLVVFHNFTNSSKTKKKQTMPIIGHVRTETYRLSTRTALHNHSAVDA